MRDGKAKIPKTDTKVELQKLWEALKMEPPGKIVGVRSRVVVSDRRKTA